MKKILAIVSLLLAGQAGAIGLQHGLFRSQSTQGTPWQGTAKIVDERYDITVYPDYLDVELEWEMEVGGTPPDSFRNALEIVGNINLVDKSTVVGMITWYNGMVLKGKLKTNEVARAEYEEVVDRDSDIPPPPRDPVLIEWIRDDNYDISIFPVTFGKTRRVRFRYLIPAFVRDGVNKMDYPHAFTDGARVTIRPGPGVKSYRVETDKEHTLYEDLTPVILSSEDYAFQAYGRGDGRRISSIVPVLKKEKAGSRFYTGDFSTSGFSGQMIHVTTLSGEEVLAGLDMPEDFVILWRWNHPGILEKYARQVVEQSALLRTFLASLDAAGERAALIIDKEGGERVVFSLDSPGGAEYRRMLDYLAVVEARTVVDPSVSQTPRQGEPAFDVEQAMAEFREALAAAVALFQDGSPALKHLLVLTAGPKLVSTYAADQSIEVDPSVNISLLPSYVKSRGASAADLGSGAFKKYWPGVDLDKFISAHGGGYTITATVGNGVDTASIAVSGGKDDVDVWCVNTGTSQMHLYAQPSLQPEIRWNIRQAGRVIAAYTETPQVVKLTDGMQYARVIGASVHLRPLAEYMPSSVAAALGFVDEKYSLVALEEDALPGSEAAQYETAGVPLLTSADIHPAADEVFDVPAAEWLAVHLPEPMADRYCGWYGRGWLVEDVFMALPDNTVPPPVDAGARVATPAAPVVYAGDPDAYNDYSDVLPVEDSGPAGTVDGRLPMYKQGGFLVVDLSAYSSMQRQQLTLILYDLTGRPVCRINGSDLGAADRVVIRTGATTGLWPGAYTAVLSGEGVLQTGRVVVW